MSETEAIKTKALLEGLPLCRLDDEHFDTLLSSPDVQIERIVSQGHHSPQTGWYDQDHNEWVLIFRGSARLEFEDGELLRMEAGDFVDIAAHRKHRVSWTDPDVETVWLAVRYGFDQ